jgi:hypothetical protein
MKMSYNFQSNISFIAESEEEARELMIAYVNEDIFDHSENYILENIRELLPWEKKGLIEDQPEPINLQTANCCKDCPLNFPEQCLLRINQQIETCDRYEG